MRLYLIRHAEAEQYQPSGTDEGRALTDKGLKNAQQIGTAMDALGIKLSLLWTSPLLRAVQTAEAISDSMKKCPTPVVEEALGIPGDFNKFRAALRKVQSTKIAIVGHMPFLGECFRYWLTGDAHPGLNVAKGSVICLEARSLTRSGMELKFMLNRKLASILAGG